MISRWMKPALILGIVSCMAFPCHAADAPTLTLLEESKASIEDENVHFWYMIGDDVAAEFLSMNNNLAKLFTVTGVEAEDMGEYLQYKSADDEDDAYVTGTPRFIGTYEVRGLGEDATPTVGSMGYRVEAPQVMVQNDTYETLYSPELARVDEYTEGLALSHERTNTTEDTITYTVTVTGTLKAFDAEKVGKEDGTYFFPWQLKVVSKEDVSITSTTVEENGEERNAEGTDGLTMQELFKVDDMVISDPFLNGILPIKEDSSLTITIAYEGAPDLVYDFDFSELSLEE